MTHIYAIFILLFALVSPFNSYSTEEPINQARLISKAFTSVAQKISPAVVNIKVEKKTSQMPFSDFSSPFDNSENPLNQLLKKFFNRPNHDDDLDKPQNIIVGQGSGFLISKDGLILTNFHLVGNVDKVDVKLLDGREFVANIVGSDSLSDIAVIKIEGSEYPYASFADSDELEVGEWVIAIGNPFGLSHTLTAGIVSAKGRSGVGISDYENFIQTDAAINPGNSGGPLVNLDGQVVGMNTAIISRTGGYMGIGFAIPSNILKDIKDQLIAYGSVTRGYVGISIQALTQDLAKAMKIKLKNGILVSDVLKDSPAEKAGLKRGDIITSFDGKIVNDVGSFRNSISLMRPGTKKSMEIYRNGKNQSIKITIGKLISKKSVGPAKTPQSLYKKYGIKIETFTPESAKELGIEYEPGVLITEVNPYSIAAIVGLRKGSLVLEVNKHKVETSSDFEKTVKKAKKTEGLLLLVKEGEFTRYIALKVNE